jgi:ubiquinone/menaquinone biosynthesis C-methylase UbiE
MGSPAGDALELAYDVGRARIDTRLTVVRFTGEVERRRIHELALPYEDRSFGDVECHHGFQFLPDRGGALAEMRRVLVDGGNLSIEVPGAIERNPPFADLADSLERIAGPRRAAAVRWPFCMPEPDDLRGVLATAGFDEIEVDVVQTAGVITAERIIGRARR